LPEYCDGYNNNCTDDKKKSSVTICRRKGGDCDIEEYCDGYSNNCPFDEKKSNSTVCRPSKNECDKTEYCNGKNNTCPPNEYYPCYDTRDAILENNNDNPVHFVSDGGILRCIWLLLTIFFAL
jgi:hypothetical protein